MTMTINMVIPPTVAFEDLGLAVAENGSVRLQWAPLAIICAANGYDHKRLLGDQHAILLPVILRGWLELLADAGENVPNRDVVEQIVAKMWEDALRANPRPSPLVLTVCRGAPEVVTRH